MSRKIGRSLLVSVVASIMCASLARADQTILGSLVQLKQKPGVPTSRTVAMKAKEVATTNTLTGDPQTNGATLTVTTQGGTPTTQVFTLGTGAMWKRLPADPLLPAVAWQYKDPHGTVSAVSKIALKLSSKGQFDVKISGKSGRPVDIVPPNPGSYVGFVFTINGPGGDSYCVNFGGAAGGSLVQKGDASFAVKKPTAEGTCPADPPVCGDGVIQSPAETCDVGADDACPGLCGSEGVPCNCPATTFGTVTVRVTHDSPSGAPFRGRSLAPGGSRALAVDVGWSGISHDLELLEGAEFTAELMNCDGTTDTLCDLNGATNGVSFGAPTPFSSGGVAVCIDLAFASDMTGSLDLASGDLTEAAALRAIMYAGTSVDTPCPYCLPADQDPQLGESGTCHDGVNAGQPCTVEALADPSFLSARGTSTACPPLPAVLFGEFNLKFAATTGVVSFGTSAASPLCSAIGHSTEACPCALCNDGDSTPCTADADCPESGGAPGICGGKRCIAGTNEGAPCTVASECAVGGICGRPGEPTRPDACYEDAELPGGCQAVGDGKAECANGPLMFTCAIQRQRGCVTDGDCPASGDHCTSAPRKCFLDPIEANGTPDPPSENTAHPVLAGTFCMGTSFSAAVNAVTGLPGPVRFVWPAEVSVSQ
jgi:hypothetical protein